MANLITNIRSFESCLIAKHASNCGVGEWQCNNGDCIPISWKCDGEWIDCADDSDEAEDTCRKLITRWTFIDNVSNC